MKYRDKACYYQGKQTFPNSLTQKIRLRPSSVLCFIEHIENLLLCREVCLSKRFLGPRKQPSSYSDKSFLAGHCSVDAIIMAVCVKGRDAVVLLFAFFFCDKY